MGLQCLSLGSDIRAGLQDRAMICNWGEMVSEYFIESLVYAMGHCSDRLPSSTLNISYFSMEAEIASHTSHGNIVITNQCLVSWKEPFMKNYNNIPGKVL